MLDIEQTQEIGNVTQDFKSSPVSTSVNSTGSPSQNFSFSWTLPSSGIPMFPAAGAPLSEGGDIDTQMLQDMTISNTVKVDDTEMLSELSSLRSTDQRLRCLFQDIETQTIPFIDPQSIESIESYGPDAVADNIETDAAPLKPAQTSIDVEKQVDNGLQCECGIAVRV